MLISYQWLQSYFDEKLPPPEKLAEVFSFGFAEVESVSKVGTGSAADWILDVKVLPDRACYALSHRGVAREAAALLGLEIKDGETGAPRVSRGTRPLSARIAAKELCPRYAARVIENVLVGASPAWLRERLESIGERSINNIVDATNFTMFDRGQPLHAFDADKVEGGITVRKARTGERLTTLDGKDLALDEGALVIADDVGPLALAGVKGGKRAEVTAGTKTIILEAASFSASFIRRVSQTFSIRTESSRRFENNLSPWLAGEGSDACASLVHALCPRARFGKLVDVFPKKRKPPSFPVSCQFVRDALGIKLSEKDIRIALARLGITVKKRGASFRVTPPLLRLDLTRSEDIAEEVGRIIGYDKIPEAELLHFHTPTSDVSSSQHRMSALIRDTLIAEGFSEVLTSSFAARGNIPIEKPLAADKAYCRPDLWTNFHPALLKNFANAPLLGTEEVRQCEIGKIFTTQGERLALIFGCMPAQKSVRGMVRKLETMLGTRLNGKFCGGENVYECVLDGIRARDSLDTECLKPTTLGVGSMGGGFIQFLLFSPYPFIVRDVAFFMPHDMDAKRAEAVIHGDMRGKEVVSLRLFDSFEKMLPDGSRKTSLAFRLVFQSMKRTLTDAEVNAAMEDVYRTLRSRGCEIR